MPNNALLIVESEVTSIENQNTSLRKSDFQTYVDDGQSILPVEDQHDTYLSGPQVITYGGKQNYDYSYVNGTNTHYYGVDHAVFANWYTTHGVLDEFGTGGGIDRAVSDTGTLTTISHFSTNQNGGNTILVTLGDGSPHVEHTHTFDLLV